MMKLPGRIRAETEFQMKVKDGFVMRDVLGKTMVVPTEEAGRDLHGFIRLNPTGKLIWTSIAEGKTIEETAKVMTETYEVDEATALADVKNFVEKMKEAGVFEE